MTCSRGLRRNKPGYGELVFWGIANAGKILRSQYNCDRAESKWRMEGERMKAVSFQDPALRAIYLLLLEVVFSVIPISANHCPIVSKYPSQVSQLNFSKSSNFPPVSHFIML